jgi:hypothetical protein
VRGFSPLINILLTCAAALAVVPVLGMPWFAGAVDSNDGHQGSVELMGEAIGRWFSAAGSTTTGADALTSLETALLALAAATAVLALGMLVAPLRTTLRGLVKLLPLAAPAVVLAAMLTESATADVEPRYGAFVALALTVFMASAAQQAGEMREPKTVAKPYEAGAGRAF